MTDETKKKEELKQNDTSEKNETLSSEELEQVSGSGLFDVLKELGHEAWSEIKGSK